MGAGITQLRLMRWFPKLHRRVWSEMRTEGVVWTETKAFSRGVGRFIWLNVRGREPKGIVDSDTEYEELRTWLQEVLLSVRDPVTEEAAFRAVHRREEIYRGPFLDRAADLVLIWSDVPLKGLHCELDGRDITVDQPHDDQDLPWTGGHRDLGILIVRGPGIRQGVELPICHLCDITPTLLYLFGQPVPRDLDGRVLTEMFEENGRRPIEFTEESVIPSDACSVDERPFSQKEMDIVEDRLRALGYLE